MKTYQTTPCTIISKSDALDELYDLRDALSEQPDETLDNEIVLPKSVNRLNVINAISSLLYWENRRKKKENKK